MVVEVVVVSDGEEQRVFPPDAVDEMLVIGSISLQEHVLEVYTGVIEVSDVYVLSEAVNDGVLERGLHERSVLRSTAIVFRVGVVKAYERLEDS